MTFKQLFKNEEHRLNAFFGLGYIALIFVLAGLVWLVDERFPTEISTFDFILLSLATFRLIRLFVYDKVSLFVREYFADEKSGPKKTSAKVATDSANHALGFTIIQQTSIHAI